jgi:hypothetical protein
MVAEDFVQDPQMRKWLDGVEPAWTLLTFDSLRALRQEPSALQTAIRIANDLNADEIAGSAVARNTFILLRQAIERGGLPLTATGNLSRAVGAMTKPMRFGSTRSLMSPTSCRCISFDCSQRRPTSCEYIAGSWWRLPWVSPC